MEGEEGGVSGVGTDVVGSTGEPLSNEHIAWGTSRKRKQTQNSETCLVHGH